MLLAYRTCAGFRLVLLDEIRLLCGGVRARPLSRRTGTVYTVPIQECFNRGRCRGPSRTIRAKRAVDDHALCGALTTGSGRINRLLTDVCRAAREEATPDGDVEVYQGEGPTTHGRATEAAKGSLRLSKGESARVRLFVSSGKKARPHPTPAKRRGYRDPPLPSTFTSAVAPFYYFFSPFCPQRHEIEIRFTSCKKTTLSYAYRLNDNVVLDSRVKVSPVRYIIQGKHSVS